MFDRLVQPLVASALRGINGTVFAYGQTASGKTYTMSGLLRLSAHALFEGAERLRDAKGGHVAVSVAFLEVYNEQLRDLLASPSGPAERLRIREHRVRGVHIAGLQEAAVSDAASLVRLAASAEANRAVASTAVNECSSRAHSICRITVVARSEGEHRHSALQLIDLAGSEVHHTPAPLARIGTALRNCR